MVAKNPVLICQLKETAALGGAGIVDQDVKLAQRIGRKRNRIRASFRVHQIGRMRDHAHVGFRLDALGDVVEVLLVARDEANVDAFVSQGPGDCCPDSLACAGNDGGLSVKIQFQFSPPTIASAMVCSVRRASPSASGSINLVDEFSASREQRVRALRRSAPTHADCGASPELRCTISASKIKCLSSRSRAMPVCFLRNRIARTPAPH
jgi:hypothetical protein